MDDNLTNTEPISENVKSGYLPTLLSRGYHRFLRIHGEPRDIALGFALGLFVGMSPFMGVQTPIAVFFAMLFGWNKISSAIGVWISNPFSAPVLYGLTYLTGAKIMGVTRQYQLPSEFTYAVLLESLKKTPEFITILILGGIVLGVPIAIIGYFLSFSAIHRYQEDIKRKLRAKKEEFAERRKRKKRKKKKKSRKT